MKILVVGVLLVAMPASAQPPSPQASASLAVAERGGGEWTDFVSREDGFHVNFPATPTVTETTYYDNDYPPPPRTGGTGAVVTGGGPDPNVIPRAR